MPSACVRSSWLGSPGHRAPYSLLVFCELWGQKSMSNFKSILTALHGWDDHAVREFYNILRSYQLFFVFFWQFYSPILRVPVLLSVFPVGVPSSSPPLPIGVIPVAICDQFWYLGNLPLSELIDEAPRVVEDLTCSWHCHNWRWEQAWYRVTNPLHSSAMEWLFENQSLRIWKIYFYKSGQTIMQ